MSIQWGESLGPPIEGERAKICSNPLYYFLCRFLSLYYPFPSILGARIHSFRTPASSTLPSVAGSPPILRYLLRHLRHHNMDEGVQLETGGLGGNGPGWSPVTPDANRRAVSTSVSRFSQLTQTLTSVIVRCLSYSQGMYCEHECGRPTRTLESFRMINCRASSLRIYV